MAHVWITERRTPTKREWAFQDADKTRREARDGLHWYREWENDEWEFRVRKYVRTP